MSYSPHVFTNNEFYDHLKQSFSLYNVRTHVKTIYKILKIMKNRKSVFVKLCGEKVKFLNIHRKTTYMSIESNSNLKVKNVRERNFEFSTVLNFPKPCFLLYLV